MNDLADKIICGDCIEILTKVCELGGLLSDMRVTAGHLGTDPHLLGWVTNQFRVRMDSRKDYTPEWVLAGSRELA
jgi:hypothetical protein